MHAVVEVVLQSHSLELIRGRTVEIEVGVRNIQTKNIIYFSAIETYTAIQHSFELKFLPHYQQTQVLVGLMVIVVPALGRLMETTSPS